ncbi:hypothetical protein C9374_014004 [Naegleria lovaniensis]|uniref:Zn(2)-C6 fungal-type domain-containing protein n=1 Tax=Naegleria lovaniensis TaxID=51637 RepID=A0AA88H0V1_NAELO|nr:uncharacterized protein C9374_014004 [Naegleria lovaniensis]KAG2389444.1 hypothetical protein C9374_014004 [Naegleria lovaniensis]
MNESSGGLQSEHYHHHGSSTSSSSSPPSSPPLSSIFSKQPSRFEDFNQPRATSLSSDPTHSSLLTQVILDHGQTDDLFSESSLPTFQPISLPPSTSPSTLNESDNQSSPKKKTNSTNKTKTPRKPYVKRACVNCKQSHAACDDSRPCKRCISLKLEDQCVDAVRKKSTSQKRKINSKESDEENSTTILNKSEKKGKKNKSITDLHSELGADSNNGPNNPSSSTEDITRHDSTETMNNHNLTSQQLVGHTAFPLLHFNPGHAPPYFVMIPMITNSGSSCHAPTTTTTTMKSNISLPDTNQPPRHSSLVSQQPSSSSFPISSSSPSTTSFSPFPFIPSTTAAVPPFPSHQPLLTSSSLQTHALSSNSTTTKTNSSQQHRHFGNNKMMTTSNSTAPHSPLDFLSENGSELLVSPALSTPSFFSNPFPSHENGSNQMDHLNNNNGGKKSNPPNSLSSLNNTFSDEEGVVDIITQEASLLKSQIAKHGVHFQDETSNGNSNHGDDHENSRDSAENTHISQSNLDDLALLSPFLNENQELVNSETEIRNLASSASKSRLEDLVLLMWKKQNTQTQEIQDLKQLVTELMSIVKQSKFNRDSK